MGANTFEVIASGKTAKEAFDNAVSEALAYARADARENGEEYQGYSGTIAEKRNFVMVKLPKGKHASAYVQELIDAKDARIDDKFGPAGCIELGSGEWMFFGWASA